MKKKLFGKRISAKDTKDRNRFVSKIISLFLFILTLLSINSTIVSALPPTPESYWGWATLDESPAPDGTPITVEVYNDTGEQVGSATTITIAGQNGYYSLDIIFDDPSTAEDEGADEGDQLTWKINDTICSIPSPGSDTAVSFNSNGNFNLTAAAGDITPPTITITSPANTTTYSTKSISLNYTINETTSWVGYSLNGAANVTLTGNTTITAAEGSNNIIVYANDTSGNMGSSVVYFTVDTAPTITIISPAANETYTETWIWANVSLDQVGDTVLYSLDSNENQTLTKLNSMYFYKNISDLTETQHSIIFYANDTGGKMNSSSTRYFTINTSYTPPSPPAPTKGEGNDFFLYDLFEDIIDAFSFDLFDFNNDDSSNNELDISENIFTVDRNDDRSYKTYNYGEFNNLEIYDINDIFETLDIFNIF